MTKPVFMISNMLPVNEHSTHIFSHFLTELFSISGFGSRQGLREQPVQTEGDWILDCTRKERFGYRVRTKLLNWQKRVNQVFVHSLISFGLGLIRFAGWLAGRCTLSVTFQRTTSVPFGGPVLIMGVSWNGVWRLEWRSTCSFSWKPTMRPKETTQGEIILRGQIKGGGKTQVW